MKLKIKIITGLLFLLLYGFCNSSDVFAVSAYGLNTLAGNSTILRTSEVAPGTNLTFVVRRPDGSTFDLSATSNSAGVALKEVSDYYTRLAGRYDVAVRTSEGQGHFRSFNVYPNKVSPHKSSVSPTEHLVNIPSEKAFFRVRLVDDYNNPIEGHAVRLIPSSNDSVVRTVSQSGKTDRRGEIEFEATSSNAGRVTYSVYDVASDVTLEAKARVVYMAGSGLFASAFGNAAGPVNRLEFIDLPESVSVGDEISLTLAAYDAQEQKVVNYSGRVRFAVVSDNSAYANLPGDYQFTPADQGKHTFGLGFSFLREGVYDLEVRDLENPAVRGAVSLEVSAVGVSPPANGIIITSPSSGAVFGNNVQIVTGTASPGANLRIFNNDVRIGDVVADAAGSFSFTTGRLNDGEHKLYVASVNEVGTIISTSPVINFSIRTLPSEIASVSIEPDGEIGAGQIIKVGLIPTDDLSRASMFLDGTTHDMVRGADGVYEVSVPAPIEFGEYPLSFFLVDELGNEATFRDETVLRVGPSAPPEVERPGAVRNLKTIPEDRRITLNWDPPAVGAETIVHYRVFYGFEPNQLTEVVDTFTDATTWYVPNLENGRTYHFAVAGVNARGGVSDSFENIVASVPMPAVVEVDLVSREEEMEALKELEEDVSDAGPEILWLVFLSVLGGIFYSQTSKKRWVVEENF